MNKKVIIIVCIVLIITSFTLLKLNKPKIINNKGENMPKLNIKIKNKIFTATLYDNETTREFIKNLPLTINMSELNGNEKYYYMDKSFKTNEENIKNIKKGDLMLYNSNCLVLFYKSFITSYSYTKLGFIEDPTDLEELLGNGKVDITFELKDNI